MSNEISELEESIHLLNIINADIQEPFSALIRLADFEVDENLVRVLNYSSHNAAMVNVKTYLDEYKIFLSCLTTAQREMVKAVYKILIKEIQKITGKDHKGVNNYRNQVAAHNYRIKVEEKWRSIYLYGGFRNYQIPKNLAEYYLLTWLIQLVTTKIYEAFPSAYEKVAAAVSIRQEEDITPLHPQLSIDDVQIWQQEILEKIRNLN